jgi:hypothetical protein
LPFLISNTSSNLSHTLELFPDFFMSVVLTVGDSESGAAGSGAGAVAAAAVAGAGVSARARVAQVAGGGGGEKLLPTESRQPIRYERTEKK